MRSAPLLATLAIVPALSGCAMDMFGDDTKPAARPAVYDSMATGSIKVDKGAAVAMISQYRRTKGLSLLRLDPQLVAFAQNQADAMAAKGVMSHDAGGSFSSRLRQSGIKAVASAENIAAGYHTLADAFSGWRGSPGHNANMLLPEATRFGIATATNVGTKYKVYWAMVVAGDPPKIPDGVTSGGPMGLMIAR